MRFFLDTANLDEIRDAVSWNLIDGVTTNPSLIRRAVLALRGSDAETDMEGYIKKMLAQVGRMCPVSLEVAATDAEEMTAQGITLYEKFNQVAGNVVIKIPVCTLTPDGTGRPFDGLVAIQALADEKIPVNATLIFTPEQALLAAKAGAEYASLFVGRVDDRIRTLAGISFGKEEYFPAEGMCADTPHHELFTDHGLLSGVDLVERTVAVFDRYEIECEVIAASIRNAVQVREIAEAGADIATVPFAVLTAMISHPGTAAGIESFTADLVDEYVSLFRPETGTGGGA